MKTIGIIGGMSPESTVLYYQHIINQYREKSNDYGFPEIVIYSITLQKLINWGTEDRWDKVAEELAQKMAALHRAGADFGLLSANTMHKVFNQIRKESPIPLLSIIEVTAKAIHSKNLKTIGLLGTKTTMSDGFYQEDLAKEKIETITPNTSDQEFIHNIIMKELGIGIIEDATRKRVLNIIKQLENQGAQGIILGCTELPLLIKQTDCDIPVFDTALIHASAAFEYAISE